MAIVYTLHIGFADANGNCTNALDNRRLLSTALNSFDFDGYTILEGTGYYDNKCEPSANVIFILPDDGNAIQFSNKVREAGQLYKQLAGQAEVWFTKRYESLERL